MATRVFVKTITNASARAHPFVVVRKKKKKGRKGRKGRGEGEMKNKKWNARLWLEGMPMMCDVTLIQHVALS